MSTRERIAYVEKTLGKKGKKTSGKFLSLVVMFGVVCASLIGVGAGCTNDVLEKTAPVINSNDPTPAQVREKVTQNKDEEFAKTMITLKESGFANFTLQYPIGWVVEHSENKLTIENSENANEYFMISSAGFEGSKKMSEDTLTHFTLGDLEAVRYIDNAMGGPDEAFEAVEVGESRNKLFIRGRGDRFEDVLNSVKF